MNNTARLLKNVRIYYNNLSRSAANTTEVVNPAFKKLKENQKRFQIDDGVPVFLKAGLRDRVLFAFTCIMTAVGLGMSAETFYILLQK